AIELTRRIRLESNLIETNQKHRRSFIVRDGRLRPVPEGFHLLAPSHLWPFIMTDIFSWSGKARMALDLLIPRRKESNGLADESVAHFVRRRLGREAFERMAQPMIGGIYTADPEQLSLRATLPRFLDMEREHGSGIRAMWKKRGEQGVNEAAGTSGARYGLFLSFDQGMQTLVDALASGLPPPTVRLNARAHSTTFDQATKQWTIRTANGELLRA